MVGTLGLFFCFLFVFELRLLNTHNNGNTDVYGIQPSVAKKLLTSCKLCALQTLKKG